MVIYYQDNTLNRVLSGKPAIFRFKMLLSIKGSAASIILG